MERTRAFLAMASRLDKTPISGRPGSYYPCALGVEVSHNADIAAREGREREVP